MSSALAELDACAQAECVRRGEVSPARAGRSGDRAHRARRAAAACAWWPALFDEARAAASAPALPDGPFRGVPFLMKDLGATQAGQPYYAGNRALRDAGYRAPQDTYLGARFRRAGLIALGKTNTPEFGLQSTTQPLAFGPTHNPWDLRAQPGRLVGRLGGRRRGGARADRARERRRRLDPHPGGLVRCGRAEAVARPRAGGSDLDRSRLRRLRDDALGARRRGVARRRARPRAGRPLPRAAADAALRRGARRADRLAAGRDADADARTSRSTRNVAPRRSRWPGCSKGSDTASKRTVRRRSSRRNAPCGTWVFGMVEYRLCLRGLAQLLDRPIGPDDVEPFLWSIADPLGPVALRGGLPRGRRVAAGLGVARRVLVGRRLRPAVDADRLRAAAAARRARRSVSGPSSCSIASGRTWRSPSPST